MDIGHDLTQLFSASFWDERYSGGRQWSGEPNPQLVHEVADLVPGSALDVGCGEGGDAIWLARQGWRVTGMDVSAVALARAAEHAGDLDVTWVQADVVAEAPTGSYDLVSAHFIHMPPPQLKALHQRLADVVAPGGTLLIVGHDWSDTETGVQRPAIPELYFTADEVAASFAPDEWTTVVAENRPRTFDGMTIHDAVIRMRRR
jgi:SAM-dependent methyltransferase